MNEGTRWMDEASCAALSPRELNRLFFTDRGTDQAKALCDSCPVSLECFLSNFDDPIALIAGTTARERGTAA